MKVLLIWPYHGDKKIQYIPLSLAYLSANIDQNKHHVEILDTVLENLKPNSNEFLEAVRNHSADIIGFSLTSDKFANTVSFARGIKSQFPRIPIIVGGIHVTSYTQETMTYDCFDYGFTGEAEFAFPQFLDALEEGNSIEDIPGLCFRSSDGKVKRNIFKTPEILDQIRRPSWEDIDLIRYYDSGYNLMHAKTDHAPIWISRGCPYRCQFCASPDINGRKMRYHSPDYVEEWIRYLYKNLNVRYFNIIDDNFTFEMDKSKEILRRLCNIREELQGINFGFPNGIRMQRVDEEMCHLISKAGFLHICLAPESGSSSILKLMQKGMKPEIIKPKIEMFKAAGLKVTTFWIVGYPGETVETLEETRKIIMSSGTNMIGLHRFQALPGTPIFDKLVSDKKISRSYLPHSYHMASNDDYVTEELNHKIISSYQNKVYLQHYLTKPWNLINYIKIVGFRTFILRLIQVFTQWKTVG